MPVVRPDVQTLAGDHVALYVALKRCRGFMPRSQHSQRLVRGSWEAQIVEQLTGS